MVGRILAISRQEARHLRSDPAPFVLLVIMPLVVMAFLNPLYGLLRPGEGSGAQASVPRLTVMFAFFLVSLIGYSFFQEHTWGTWVRLRSFHLRPFELMAGKAIPALGLSFAQCTLLFVFGHVLFGFHVNGSFVALVAVLVANALCLVAIGLSLAVLCTSVYQLSALAYTSAMILGGLGGSLSPVHLLPQWAQHLAPITPTYWANRALTTVVVGGGGVRDVMRPVGVLLGTAVVFGALALWRFRFDQAKVAWS
jgi:ABC-2 type transport system permease protein